LTPLKIRNLKHEPEHERDKLLDFIVSQAKRGTKSIGFIPRLGLEQAVETARVIVLENNDDQVGFAVTGGNRTRQKIFQVWVREDARLILHGRALVDHIDMHASKRGRMAISLWCLETLPSNLFWEALGFKECERRMRSLRHSHEQIRWVRPTIFAQRSLFATSEGSLV
jgi:GNAT superfamily N-acetyltransferase